MTIGRLYNRIVTGEPLRTRAILPTCLIEHYNLDVETSGPDEVFPSSFDRGLVPSFQWADGTLLSESIPITFMLLHLVPNQSFMGDMTLKTRSAIMQWMTFMNIDIVATMTPVGQMQIGIAAMDETRFKEHLKHLQTNNKIVEKHLSKSKYLAGDTLTIADLYGVPCYFRGFKIFFDAEWRQDHPHIWKWWCEVSKHEVFNEFFSDFKPVEKVDLKVQDS